MNYELQSAIHRTTIRDANRVPVPTGLVHVGMVAYVDHTGTPNAPGVLKQVQVTSLNPLSFRTL